MVKSYYDFDIYDEYEMENGKLPHYETKQYLFLNNGNIVQYHTNLIWYYTKAAKGIIHSNGNGKLPHRINKYMTLKYVMKVFIDILYNYRPILRTSSQDKKKLKSQLKLHNGDNITQSLDTSASPQALTKPWILSPYYHLVPRNYMLQGQLHQPIISLL